MTNYEDREVWEMTREEWVKTQTKDIKPYNRIYGRKDNYVVTCAIRLEGEFHQNKVIKALRAGELVPPEVLADYPNLSKQGESRK